MAPRLLPLSQNTPEERRLATRHTASRAVDAVDCRLLLDALGLLPPPPGARPKRTAAPGTTTADCPINTTQAVTP
ncbi:hypothetical protein ABZX40_13240 [Streptomyces sp. NPDC004610]|uniref:hypothetical protein n=1 Tax=unclassified Streptomyces TaxID=2593676 RepID=UPI00339E4A12